MASGYLGGAKNIFNITSVYQYFISIVLCFMFVSFTSSKADLINDGNKLIYPLEFGTENKNNEMRHPYAKSVSSTLHSLSLNPDESVDSITTPGNRSDSTKKSNLLLYLKNVSNNSEFESRKNPKSSCKVKSRPFLDTELIRKFRNNISRTPKGLLDYIKQTKLKNSVHIFESPSKKNNTSEMTYNKLKSECSNKMVMKRHVDNDSRPEFKEVIINSKNDTNINKLTFENFEFSRQKPSTYSQENDNNDMDYLDDQYESDSETNENIRLVSAMNSKNSKNLSEKELKRNYTNNRQHRKKGVKKIKQSRNKNSTKNDHNLHPKMHNLQYDIASEFKSTNSYVFKVDPLEALKVGIMKRDELKKLNSSEKLKLLKNLIDKELAEHTNKNKRIPDDSNENWPQLPDDQSNISSEPKWSDDEPTTIPISINVFIYNDVDPHTTVSTYYSDIPQFLMRPFEEYDPWRYANPDELDVFGNNSSVSSSPEEDSSPTVTCSQAAPSKTPMPQFPSLFQDIDNPVEITILNATDIPMIGEEPEKSNELDEDIPSSVDSRKGKNDDSDSDPNNKPDNKICEEEGSGKTMITAMTILSLLAVTVLCGLIIIIGWKLARQKISKKESTDDDCIEENDQPQDAEACEEEHNSFPEEDDCPE